MEQHYKFNPSSFNADGINRKDGTFILKVVREWEQDFHDRFSPIFADSIYANYFTMRLIQNCLAIGDQENRGIISFEGAFYLGRSLKVENCIISPKIIYAIGSKFDVDKPIWLVRDDSMVDGIAILKYISDSDDEYKYDANPILPVKVKRNKER